MKRYIGVAIGLGLLLVVLALTSAGPALAQGAIKPIMAFIVNDRANPVPVVVTNDTPAPPALVKCTRDLGGGSSPDPIIPAVGGGWFNVITIDCPAGVTALDVQRVTYAPGVTAAATQNNVVHWQVVLGPSSAPDTTLEPGEVIAVLTAGAPDTVLSRPLRVDLTLPLSGFAWERSGSTGIAGIGAQLSGSLIFEGVPVP
jgi:hypothetical protein